MLNANVENLLNPENIYLDEEFTFHLKSSQLFYKGTLINLTKKERELLKLLLNNINSLVSIDTMEYAIWPEQESSPTRRRALLSRLRAKLNHKFIKTHSSEGYIFSIDMENNSVCRA
jgi:DNA-binding response OmpR family regulator